MCAVPENECLSERARSQAPRIWLRASISSCPCWGLQQHCDRPSTLILILFFIIITHWPATIGPSWRKELLLTAACQSSWGACACWWCSGRNDTPSRDQWAVGGGEHSQTIKCTYLMFYLSLCGLWCLPKNYSEHLTMLFSFRKCLSLMEQMDVWSSASIVGFSVTQLWQARFWTVADCQCWSYESMTVISNVCFSLY